MRRQSVQHGTLAEVLAEILQALQVDGLAVGVQPVEHFVEETGFVAAKSGGRQQERFRE